MRDGPRVLKRVTTSSRWGRLVVVSLFALTTVGLPLEDWAAWFVPAGDTTSMTCTLADGAGCQCSPARRKAGRCCCQLSKKSTVSRCCANKTKTVAKSCCAQSKAIVADKPSTPLLTSCGCGSAEELGLLWSGEPRVLSSVVALTIPDTRTASVFLSDESLSSTRARPETPPPRDQRLSA